MNDKHLFKKSAMIGLILYVIITFVYTISTALALDTSDRNQIRNGCTLALEHGEQLIPENLMLTIIYKVTGKKEKSFVDLCEKNAITVLQDIESNQFLKFVIDFGSSAQNTPELFDQSQCLVNVNGKQVESEGNCKAGCLSWSLNQPDKYKRIGFYAGHQITFQTSRYNIMGESLYGADVAACLEGKGPQMSTCILNSCIPAYRTFLRYNQKRDK